MVPFTTLFLLFTVCWLLVIYYRLSAYLQLLRAAKLSEAGAGTCDSGIAWTLASRLDDNLSIYTLIDATRLSLRFVVDALPTGAAELMCLPREVDLVPTWNRFCAWGGVLRVASPTELWVGAVLKLPWPVPRHAILLHAQLHDRMAVAQLVDTRLLSLAAILTMPLYLLWLRSRLARRKAAFWSRPQRPPRSPPPSPRHCAPARMRCRSPHRSAG